ncbi:hypothetical protein TVAG_373480 [Trichomonas vaginalis G3]|uniref:Sulfatase N-terminal domain-containing protein n=1 Tax=Trichomonas vaginalis (strain ATCC PRA-98 / G3) TaxID=412133 RepID=A2DZL1_TRIV3|nr:lipoteichoic acid synthase family [Trichomonas vaginalis G3]EAY14215.1 hypothetical protein TVAG_373480 [Trichomonas vaginalis G3]KAI5539213.1 lipoteichoic acid synthase family [Trichomonas vaginalis G3]|eukprot:XP_001326438.1 hypothetical protein [Trichomonas vaginalis G3]
MPEKKRNIIIICLESMDSTYISVKNGGCIGGSLIPYMEELALDENNAHFSHLKFPKLGGMRTIPRTGFTLGATFGALCGIPYLGSNKFGGQTQGYLNDLSCLSELLNDHEYITSATFGCPSRDWGYGHIFEYHHYQKINPLKVILKQYSKRFWYDDYITYDFFKGEVTSLSNQKRPFFAFMSTLDTHEPGFTCKLCPEGDNDLFRAVKCADNQLKNFVEWSKNQPWYNDTVILVFGDHFSRDNQVYTLALSKNYERTTYNIFINPSVKPEKTFERVFTPYDLMPSVLAAAGIKIKGDKLGIGVNLFSNISTHFEAYQEEYLKSMGDTNYWYDTVILHKPAICDGYIPCINIDRSELYTNYTEFNNTKMDRD